MFRFGENDTPASRCYFTHVTLPANVDEKRPPVKKKPFSIIHSQAFSHTADFILPDRIYEIIRQELEEYGAVHYARVIMSLSQVIDGDFFNQYIKTGNILMLSEGRPRVDNTYSFYEGVLKLELDKATYERCGLVGKPIPHSGRKHTKARFLVELNLRELSMLHGKKGFERIVWAFKNVLNQSLTWLFYDVNATGELSGPILMHHPVLQTVRPEILRLPNIKIPEMLSIPDLCDHEYGIQVLEWLGMVSLSSPRISADDSINNYLSRYEVPMPYRPNSTGEAAITGALVRLRWHGLLPAKFLIGLWLLLRNVLEEKDWAAMSVTGFEDEAYTLMSVGKGNVLSWECK